MDSNDKEDGGAGNAGRSPEREKRPQDYLTRLSGERDAARDMRFTEEGIWSELVDCDPYANGGKNKEDPAFWGRAHKALEAKFPTPRDSASEEGL